MTTQEVADKLVALCKEFKNFVSVEASARSGSFETAGKGAVIQKSADWAAAHEIHSAAAEGPFVANDKFGVIFDFEVAPKATGKRTALREIAVYTVGNGAIVREEFFYGAGGASLSR